MATYKKMNNFVKAAWIKALRSGEYKKTKGELYNGSEDGYCCLGVLTDIYCKANKINKYNYLCGGDLDPTISNKYGISTSAEAKLINLNDGINKKRAWSFNEIADWIEENL